MKYFILLFTTAAVFASCAGSDSTANQGKQDSAKRAQKMNAVDDTANYTSIQWIDSTFQDLGKVKKGTVAEVSWRLKNTGTKPLVIAQVTPGCGCTVADKPEEPIMPGGQSVIKAKFNSAGQSNGEHRKYISVLANTKNTTNYQLQFKVDVTD